MRTVRTFLACSVIASAVLVIPPPAHACNVPLFRYALERWQPDAYRFVIIHEGPLAGLMNIEHLTWYTDQSKPTPNFMVDKLDLNKVSADDRDKLFQVHSIQRLPWLIVSYPDGQGGDRPVWQGPLSDAPIHALMDSPARRDIARRILTGEAAVWILLESGDVAADDAVEKELRGYLDKLETTLKLPELTNSPKDKLLREEPPLLISFSILRIRRNDSQEALFAHLLLQSESDLAKRKEAIVFPVFGRGIALYALVGKGINEDTVSEAANFLIGACRCEVKKLNPGTDLLMTADWEDSPDAAAAVIAGPGPGPADPYAGLIRNLIVVGFAVFAVVAAATVVIYLRRKQVA